MKTIGNRKLSVVILALLSFTLIAILKDYDLISAGTAITMIVGVFFGSNAYVHKNGKVENESK